MLINLKNKNTFEIYLSVLSIGILKCLEEDILDFDDAMALLYQPFNIDKLEKEFQKLGEAIHLGTELEDVATLAPEDLEDSLKQIEELNKKLIQANINNFKEDEDSTPIYKID
ncbi:DUF3969 family protein [Enterococcus plantarum]|uniref:DUF3969 family protein n=1 Tax=Enterococcus plantarum TaxID=1077675 RepID=UPI001A8CD70A|nr:DUF3969 family protein [Enterococcus plantarum]MBO0421447.1 DUF3969 family protein [Enterococcus plantarum]